MERIEYDHYGGPEVMRLRAFSLPPPRPEEIVVRVAASSINPMDWKIRNGVMKMFTMPIFPRGMGADFAGVVESVGSKVRQFKPGDPVLGTVPMKQSGAFAPRLITKQNLIVRKPDSLSFAAAATLPIAGVTAWHVLVKAAGLKRGQRVFLNGASGAVGQAAIAIARDIGAEVVGRVGTRSIPFANALGLSFVLDYANPLPLSLDRSFDVVFDAHGSLLPQEGDRLAKRDGKIIDIAPTGTKFLRAMVSRSRSTIFADVGAENLQQVAALAAVGKLTIPIARTISLAEAPRMIEQLEKRERVHGKVVIRFQDVGD